MPNEFVQTMADARVDARSLSEFLFKPADFMVQRRLAPSIHTLSYYLQSLSGIEQQVQDAINNTAVEGGILADTFVTVTANGVGTVARTQREKNSDSVSPFDFGVVGDGVANDTVGLRAYHTHCNKHSIAADYSGIEALKIDADAQIPINTDVDFRGVPTSLEGAYVTGGGDFTTPVKTTYIVEDESTPIQEIETSLVASRSTKNSSVPLEGVIDAFGYARIVFNLHKNPPRYTTDVNRDRYWSQSFRVMEGGFTTLPLSETLDGSDVTVYFRPDPVGGYINLKNPCLIDSGNLSRQAFITITRNKVNLSDFSLIKTAENPEKSTHTLINLNESSEFSFTGFSGKGLPSLAGDGTYILNLYGAADIYISKIDVTQGRGWMGGNFINGLYVDACKLNRIDGHESLHNVFVNSTHFILGGILYGWGGGKIIATGCSTFNTPLIIARNDYGGGWFSGDIIINGLVVAINNIDKHVVFENKNIGSQVSSKPLRIADSITMNNIVINAANTPSATPTMALLDIQPKTNVIFPESISINGVMAQSLTIVTINIPYQSALTLDSSSETVNTSSLHISNIACGKFEFSSTGISKPTGQTKCIDVLTVFSNITSRGTVGSQLSIGFPCSSLKIKDCIRVNSFSVMPYSATLQPTEVTCIGASFQNRSGTVTIGTDTTAADKRHKISFANCYFWGTYILTSAGIIDLIGCHLHSAAVTLPSGCTEKLAYTGFNRRLP